LSRAAPNVIGARGVRALARETGFEQVEQLPIENAVNLFFTVLRPSYAETRAGRKQRRPGASHGGEIHGSPPRVSGGYNAVSL